MKKILLSMMVLAVLTSCSNKAANQETGTTETAVENAANSNQVANISADDAKSILHDIAVAANRLIAEENDAQMATSASVEFDGQNFIYHFEVDETEMTIAELTSVKDELHNRLKKDFEEKKNYQVIKDNLKVLNGKVIYQYIGSHSKKLCTITLDL